MIIRNAVSKAKEILKNNNIPDYDSSATFILNHIINSSHGISLEEEMSDKLYNDYMELIYKRISREPLDMILGYTDFYNLRIPFDLNTLTPRLETELLVERVILDISNKEVDVLDMCTGSGCIGLAIAKNTNSQVTLADISHKAIETAKQNAKLNNIDNVEFVETNLFRGITKTYDIIVCNPPYIRTHDLYDLEPEVYRYDPKLALDGGNDGLDFYRVIANQSSKFLKPYGTLYLEIGYDQSKDVSELLKPYFNVSIMKDLAHIDRFIIAKKVN